MDFVHQLLEAGAIQETTQIAFQGPLFSVPKKNSVKRRVILDLSALNRFIHCPTFKMISVKDVRAILPEGAFTASVDLTDAYWHVPIARHFQKFLGFRLGRRKFKFVAMPFGLNIAPRIFTKLTRPIIEELRQKGVRVIVYLDDWLVWADSVEQCLIDTQVLLQVLDARGFKVNLQKSRLTPQRRFEWLGVLWDTSTQLVSLPEDKVLSMTQDLLSFLNKTWVTRREVERVLGKLQFASLVDPIGKNLLKNLNVYLRHFARRSLRDKKVPFPPRLRTALRRWLRPGTLRQSIGFRPPPISLSICTDASNQGWGAHSSSGESRQGSWSVSLSSCHINILELAAVYLALRSFKIKKGTHVGLHSDNTTVVNCLNRLGSARSKPLNSWVLSTLILLRRKGIYLTAFHIQGVRNVVADALSRKCPINTEWELDNTSFSLITSRFGLPEVDLFATRDNKKVPQFVSPILTR